MLAGPRPESAGRSARPGLEAREPFEATSRRCPWSCLRRPVCMALAPAGPEASLFEVLDRHRASLLAALGRGGREPARGGTHLASR